MATSSAQSTQHDQDEHDPNAIAVFHDDADKLVFSIKEYDLESLRIPELNTLMNEANLTPKVVRQIRDRRRLLKNRQYGQWGRDRRTGSRQEHKSAQDVIRQQLDAVNTSNAQLEVELQTMRDERQALEQELNVKVVMGNNQRL